MGHNIAALVIAAPYTHELAEAVDLRAMIEHPPITLFPITHYYAAYWQARRAVTGMLFTTKIGIVPNESVLADLVREIAPTATQFAVIYTDYFGGAGEQWAGVIDGGVYRPMHSVNEALRTLGVVASGGHDEWDTIGLGGFRHEPAYLEKYPDLCDELGV